MLYGYITMWLIYADLSKKPTFQVRDQVDLVDFAKILSRHLKFLP